MSATMLTIFVYNNVHALYCCSDPHSQLVYVVAPHFSQSILYILHGMHMDDLFLEISNLKTVVCQKFTDRRPA